MIAPERPRSIRSGLDFAGRLPAVAERAAELRFDRRRTEAPLAFSQEAMWFFDRLGFGYVYHMSQVFAIEGKVDVDALQAAVDRAVDRHDSLRTCFPEREGLPYQKVEPSAPLPLIKIDLRDEPDADIDELCREIARRPFDLARPPLIRLALIRRTETEHALLVTIHHIVQDGTARGILFAELGEMYRAQLAGETPALSPLPIGFSDFAAWQRTYYRDGVLDAQRRYWLERLAGMPYLELPADRPRPATATFRGAKHYFSISPEVVREVRELARSAGASFFVTLMAAFTALLHRYANQPDLAVGFPVAGRVLEQTEPIFGCFINTVLLRSTLGDDVSFREHLIRTRDGMRDAIDQQDIPFEQVVAAIAPERVANRTPLMSVMATLTDSRWLTLELDGAEVCAAPFDAGRAMLDLRLDMTQSPDGLSCQFEYATDLFDRDRIVNLGESFAALLEHAAAEPDVSLSRLTIVSPMQRRALLETLSGAAVAAPAADCCIHEMIDEQVARTPNALALHAGDDELSYRELADRAGRLAARLRGAGIGAGAIVGILHARDAELVVAMLAVLKAGAAYLPLDPAYPIARLSGMLDACGAALVLTQTALRSKLPADVPVLELDGPERVLAPASPRALAGCDDVAYVIFTSGSTGKPKGVAIAHRNAVARLQWAREAYAPEELAGVLASTSVSFDLSIFEIFGTLAAGGTVVLVENALALADLHPPVALTLINTVPSAVSALLDLDAIPATVKTINLAGEPLAAELVRRIYQGTRVERVYNLYGPTEDTTYSTTASVARDCVRPSIGRPLPGTRVYLLDELGELVAPGAMGELYLGGAGTSNGYVNRPDVTAERFRRVWFSDQKSERLYRTGDLARFRADGELDFIGRADRQVKLRGFRIELGEIEAALRTHPGVRDAAVVVRGSAGDAQLVASFVATPETSTEVDELRLALASQLPAYMVPHRIEQLVALPLTANGKVDYKALAAVPLTIETRHAAILTAQDPIESELRALWERLLGVVVRPGDNFFDLGGTSVRAAQMVGDVGRRFGQRVALSSMLAEPTVEHLAAELRGGLADCGPIRILQANGDKPPLVFLHGDMNYGGFYCRELAAAFGDDQPFYALAPFEAEKGALPPTVEATAAAYVGALRELRPHGPYRLAGVCNGALVAFEMARILHRQGEPIDALFLINTVPARKCSPWQDALMSFWSRQRWLSRTRRETLLFAIGRGVRALRTGRVFRKVSKRLGVRLGPTEAYIGILARSLTYHPRRYDGPATVLWSAETPAPYRGDPTHGWGKLAATVDVQSIPGDHITSATDYGAALVQKMKASLRT